MEDLGNNDKNIFIDKINATYYLKENLEVSFCSMLNVEG